MYINGPWQFINMRSKMKDDWDITTLPKGKAGVSGYVATGGGRNISRPATRGFQSLPTPKPKRFAVNYHLLAVRESAPRVTARSVDGPRVASPSRRVSTHSRRSCPPVPP